MANINEILARAAALRDETALNSIDPERAGSIMYDTLIALNELWLQQGAALVISKIYASVAAMNADTSPVSDLTGQPIRPGMIVVIASSDTDNGSVYRYNGTSAPRWSLVGKIGNLEPVDSLDSDSTQLPLAAHQGKVLDSKISKLGQEISANIEAVFNDNIFDPLTDGVDGKGYSTNTHGFIDNALFGYYVFQVEPGDVVLVQGDGAMQPYGYCIQNAATQRLTDAAINSNEFYIEVPANAAQIIVTYLYSKKNEFSVRLANHINRIPTIESNLTNLDNEVDEEVLGVKVAKTTSGNGESPLSPFTLASGETLYIKNTGSVAIDRIRFYDASRAQVGQITKSIASGSVGSVTVPSNSKYISLYFFGIGSAITYTGDTIRQKLDNYIVSNNTEVASINDQIEDILYGENLFDSTKAIDGQAYNATSHGLISIVSYGYIVLSVTGGNKIKLSGWSSGMSPYGYGFNSAAGSFVDSGVITGDMLIDVPNNAATMIVSYIVADKSNISIKESSVISKNVAILQEEIDTINGQLEDLKVNIPYKIKDFNDSMYLSGYRYLAFFSGVCFNGNEVHAARISGAHLAVNPYEGKIVFFIIDANGKKTTFYPDLDYPNLTGELRDPNLSVTRDGSRLLLSAFSCDPNNNSEACGAYLFVLDSDLEVVETIDLWAQEMRCVWGNTLETPDGYLLKLSYTTVSSVDYLSLWKSDQKITETTELTFTKIYDFPTIGQGLNEGTIGYVGDSLVLVSRVHGANSVLFYTSTLDGSEGWSDYIGLGYVLHSPAVPLYQKGPIFAFSGGLFVNASTRQPFILYFDLNSKVISSLTIIDTDIANAGGYPSFIQIEDNIFALMYYDDNGNNTRTKVLYQRVNARYKCKAAYFI